MYDLQKAVYSTFQGKRLSGYSLAMCYRKLTRLSRPIFIFPVCKILLVVEVRVLRWRNDARTGA